MTLSWAPVSGATGYTVRWATSSGVTGTSDSFSGAASPQIHGSLSPGVRHYYRVAATHGGGAGPLSDEVNAMPHVTPAEAVADGTIDVPAELPTLQAGLDAASAGQTVRAAEGTYRENLTWPDHDGVTLVSVGGAEVTVIDGGGLGPVISMRPTNLANVTAATIIDGFRITNGNAWQQLAGGDYDGGGGISVYGGAPIIRNNVITGNRTAYNGGGIGCLTQAAATITDNVIVSNWAGQDGGGIYLRNVSPAGLTDNTIRNNYADGCGGGFYSSPTSAPNPFTGNTIASNADHTCPALEDCADACNSNLVTWPGSGTSGGGGGGTGNAACDACLASCQGLMSCCTGNGCLCYDECTVATCNDWYCTLSGDCWCIG